MGLIIPGQNDNISRMANAAGSPPPNFQPQQIPLDQVIIQISAQVAEQVCAKMLEMKNELVLKFKLIRDTGKVPTKAHEEDACYDIYADTNKTDVIIQPGECVKIHTSFTANIPHGYWGAIFARSGLASKNGLRPAQGVPVIDEPYTGEWIIPMYNDSKEAQVIRHHDRIAQFTLLPYPNIHLQEVEELDETDRGTGGFGSSGR